MKKLLLLSLLGLSMTGCVSFKTENQATPEAEMIKAMQAPEEGAALYVYRDHGSDLNYVLFELDINGKGVPVAHGCIARIEMKPGTYHLESDHPDVLGQEQEMDLTVKAGDVRVIEYKPIHRILVPGETKLIEHSKEDMRRLLDKGQFCLMSPAKV